MMRSLVVLFAGAFLLAHFDIAVAKPTPREGVGKPIDHCVMINDNFSEGACQDPVSSEDGTTRESCKDEAAKDICTLADKTTIKGWETLDVETYADGSSKEDVCTHFSESPNATYSSYCTTLETCANGEGVCGFAVKVDGRSCDVELQTCEDPKEEAAEAREEAKEATEEAAEAEARAEEEDAEKGKGPGRSKVEVRAPVVNCAFDPDLNWNGCMQKRKNPDGKGLHVSFMSIILADKTPSSGAYTVTATASFGSTVTATCFSILGWTLASLVIQLLV